MPTAPRLEDVFRDLAAAPSTSAYTAIVTREDPAARGSAFDDAYGALVQDLQD